jgi:hypothetical protein
VTSNSNVIYHAVTLWEQVMFSENSSQAGWGTLYFAMKAVSDFSPFDFVTHQWSRRAKLHTAPAPPISQFRASETKGSWTTKRPLSRSPVAPPSQWYMPSRVTWALFKLHKLPLCGQLDIPRTLQSAVQIQINLRLTPFLSTEARTISYNILMTNQWLVSAIFDSQWF